MTTTILARVGLIFLAAAPATLFGQLSVGLNTNLAAPQTVGTRITITATASGGSGKYDYQFTANLAGSTTQVIQDFVPTDDFQWTPTLKEGNYTLGVTVRDLTDKSSSASTSISYSVVPALNQGAQAIHPTVNTLVALFSAPACPAGDSMRIMFFPAVAGSRKSITNPQPCDGATSMNFYIGGMYQSSLYTMLSQTLDSSGNVVATGSPLRFTTGAIPSSVSLPQSIFVPPASPNLVDPDQQFPVIIQGFLPSFGTTYKLAATDLAGNFIWYNPYTTPLFTRTEAGGKFFIIYLSQPDPNVADPYAQQIREIDLAGNLLIETNAEIVSEQLIAQGKPAITGFSHELSRLANGDLLTIGAEERIVTNANQCGTTGGQPNSCDVLGDEVIVLDHNMQVKWAWDEFDQGQYSTSSGVQNLIDRPAILGETCTPGRGGCPPFFLAPVANDWTHCNSAQLTGDGNIILSMRHQDWVVKLHYANGTGDGHIMWRLGNQGDFSLDTTNTHGTEDVAIFPWFSHQHDASFAYGPAATGPNATFTVFDDGNTRRTAPYDTSANSRGQLYTLNQSTLQASLVVNSDLGEYSNALGAAQLLPNGNLWFNSGIIATGNPAAPYTQEVETDNLANLVYILQVGLGVPGNLAVTYRSFRMPNLYTATQ